MPDTPHANAEPQNFGELKMQPTGSGPADLEAGYLEAALDGAAADASIEAGIADESAAYDAAMVHTDDDAASEESASHPS